MNLCGAVTEGTLGNHACKLDHHSGEHVCPCGAQWPPTVQETERQRALPVQCGIQVPGSTKIDLQHWLVDYDGGGQEYHVDAASGDPCDNPQCTRTTCR